MARRNLPSKEEPKVEVKKPVEPVDQPKTVKMVVTGCKSLFVRSDPVVLDNNVLWTIKEGVVFLVDQREGEWLHGTAEGNSEIVGYTMAKWFKEA